MNLDPAGLMDEALAAVRRANDAKELGAVRVMYLGRKGRLTEILRGLGSVPADRRAEVGRLANLAKAEVVAALSRRREELDRGSQAERPAVDVTLPGREIAGGGRHILMSILEEIREIFHGMGFSVALGPEVEDDYHNFEALNMPKGHPARGMHDTFFITDSMLLRTHTSPVQIRVMDRRKPPIRLIFPGRVYRNESIDAAHAAEFHQCEILYVDDGVSFRDLKGCLEAFVAALFGAGVRVRFRPSYFPFTEPSAELDISCVVCAGSGCPTCKRTGWVEVLGCGMVHPRVLEFVNYDAERYTGYAAGMGIERIAMVRHGIPDIRYFLENDLRFLSQF
jgi:phenylalanyl-tRNA synthetase alpha chain